MDEVVSFLKTVFSEGFISSLFGFLPSEVVTIIVVCFVFLIGLAIKRIIVG